MQNKSMEARVFRRFNQLWSGIVRREHFRLCPTYSVVLIWLDIWRWQSFCKSWSRIDARLPSPDSCNTWVRMGTSRTPPLWCIDRQWLLFSSAAEDSALCYTSQVFGSLGRAGPATQPPQPIPLLTMTSGVAIWSEPHGLMWKWSFLRPCTVRVGERKLFSWRRRVCWSRTWELEGSLGPLVPHLILPPWRFQDVSAGVSSQPRARSCHH